MEEKKIKEILLNACSTGADFAELFFEDKVSSTIRALANKIDEASKKKVYGCALRLLHGVEEVYGSTNDVTYEGLMKLANELKTSFNSMVVVKDIIFKKDNFKKHTTFANLDTDMKKIAEKAKEINKEIMSYSPLIIQAGTFFNGEIQNVTICNTEGVFITDTRCIQRMASQAVAKDENSMQSGFNSYGGNFSVDDLLDFDYLTFAKEIAEVAVKQLTAKEMVGGVYDVVIDNAFGGVIFHESCGHSLEATSVAKNLSVFSNKLGEKIASDIVTAIDDGTIPNEWGSQNYDDEGHPQQKRTLIENGVLKSYMIDYRNARRMKASITGSGRRESYRFSPTSRMSNTYIANGSSTLEEIIANTKYGLYAKSMGGGSVNPATGEFNFSVSEGYMIRDGKICEMVRGATLIGSGKDTLLHIDMVANNCTFGYGLCGSSSGSVPTCVGQPTIRVKGMTVGGKGEQ